MSTKTEQVAGVETVQILNRWTGAVIREAPKGPNGQIGRAHV